MRRAAWIALAIVAIGLFSLSADTQPASPAPRPRHVFIILLENKGFDETFKSGADDPYLAHELTKQGELLTNYYAIGHKSLDNYIALVSGQAPNIETQEDCFTYDEFRPADAPLDSDGQVHGQGCVYPTTVRTITNQLEAKGLTWRGYMEDMEHSRDRPLQDSPDLHVKARALDDQYATRHNPFVYFHTILDNLADCDSHVVPLTQLDKDLRSVATTPNFVFVTPNLCNDGHDGPSPICDGGFLKSTDRFLRGFVPKILSAPAYNQDGMLIITFDEAETADGTSCCDEPPGPNVKQPAMAGPGNRSGGGHIGTLILSRYVKAGSTNPTPYNHYTLLRGLEDIYGLKEHLGFAQKAGNFDAVFNQTP